MLETGNSRQVLHHQTKSQLLGGFVNQRADYHKVLYIKVNTLYPQGVVCNSSISTVRGKVMRCGGWERYLSHHLQMVLVTPLGS